VKVRIPQRRDPLAPSKPWRFAERLLLIVGLLAMGFAAYTYAARYVYQAFENRTFDRTLAAKNFAPSPPIASVDQHPPTASPRATSPQAASPQAVIGRITIPRLGISAMVQEGVDDKSTAMPGESGKNVGLAAHRDNLFRNLKDIARDDEITLTTLDNTYIYRVASFRVVNPEDVSVLAPRAGEQMLTLVTCYPFYFVGHAPKRFIVRARQVLNTPAVAEAPAGAFESRRQPGNESAYSRSAGIRNHASRQGSERDPT